MSGGVSHMDTFDPKPRLTADHGKPSGAGGKPFLGSLWKFQPREASAAPRSASCSRTSATAWTTSA